MAHKNKKKAQTDNLIDYFKAQQKADKETICRLRAQILELQKTITSLRAMIAALQNTLDENSVIFNETIRGLQQTINSLNEKIAKLEEQVHKNSKNSSKPPSSDGYSKPPAPHSLRKTSGKRGAPDGHKGSTLTIDRIPDKTVAHMPKGCENCPHYNECLKAAQVRETRNEIDAEVKVTLIRHDVLGLICPIHQDDRQGEFPEGINSYLQYGEHLKALAVSLNTIGAVSLIRTSDILRGVFDIPITPATIAAMVHRVAEKAGEPLNHIQAGLKDSLLLHADETGFRTEGKLHWVHVLCNRCFTFLDISKKRGWPGMEEIGLLPKCHGILTHDFWASYWHYSDNFTHNVCRAHLLRELLSVTENHPEQTWAKDFSNLLLTMKKSQEKAIRKGKSELSFSTRNRFSVQYDEIIERAYKENPEPETASGVKKRGRKKRGKVLSLIDRLKDNKASVCLIIDDLSAPFDNNQAERDLRMNKSKIKVSGCFRTVDGAKDYLKIMSCISTGRKHGHNGFAIIMNLLTGSLDFLTAI